MYVLSPAVAIASLSSFQYPTAVTEPKGPVDPPPVVRLQISRSSSGTAKYNGINGNRHQGLQRPPRTANSDESAPSSEDEEVSFHNGGDHLRPSSGYSASNGSHSHSPSKLTSASLIQSPYLFCFAALCKASEDEELYLLEDGKTRYVTGNVVSSLYHLKDPRDGSAEGFFVFPGMLEICHAGGPYLNLCILLIHPFSITILIRYWSEGGRLFPPETVTVRNGRVSLILTFKHDVPRLPFDVLFFSQCNCTPLQNCLHRTFRCLLAQEFSGHSRCVSRNSLQNPDEMASDSLGTVYKFDRLY